MAAKKKLAEDKPDKVKVSKAKVAVKAKMVTAAPKKAAPEHKKIRTAEGWKRMMLKLKHGAGKK